MKHTTHRSRRHRNPQQGEKQEKPFFSSNRQEKAKADNQPPFFQTRLKLGRAGDAFEQEADQVADAVTGRSAAPPQIQARGISRVQRYMTNAQEDELGTNTQRIEKDKAIQEKPELQRAEEEENKMQKQEEQEQEPGLQKMDEQEEPLQQTPVDDMKQEETEAQAKEEEDVQMKEEKDEMAQTAQEEELQTKEEEEEPAKTVQPKADVPAKGNTNGLHRQLKQSSGGGKPLTGALRVQMENALGADFSEVRIHTDGQAQRMNRELRAQAFTCGRHIFFNAGKFRPETAQGQHLLVHELTHVVQQGKAGTKKKPPTVPKQ